MSLSLGSKTSVSPRSRAVLGYLSGMNMVWTGEGKLPRNPLDQFNSAAQAYQWMDGFCKLNPAMKVSEGANALFFELAGKKR